MFVIGYIWQEFHGKHGFMTYVGQTGGEDAIIRI